MPRLSRRNTVQLLGSALAAPVLLRTAWADDKVLSIGMTFPITGTLALQAGVVRDAVVYAINEANEKGGIAGYKLRDVTLDDASPTTGQYPVSNRTCEGREQTKAAKFEERKLSCMREMRSESISVSKLHIAQHSLS